MSSFANGRDRFLAAMAGEPVDRPPIWLMRQAGRYLPGYRAVREKYGFWDVCQTPELSTQVALEPLDKFPLDAAIVFSDILVIPQALGLGVTFGSGHGPQVAKPLRSQEDLEAWETKGLLERLAYLPRAAAHLRQAIGQKYALLGFAGAPFTLFSYMVEGGSSDDFIKARTMLHLQPELATRALSVLAKSAAELLEAQFEAGVDCVQLFDTWGGLLSREEYARFAVPALRAIVEQVKSRPNRRVLLFIRGGHHLLPILMDTGVDGLSLDWRTPFAEARARYPSAVLQGNLDPVLLFAGPDVVAARTKALLAEMKSSSRFERCIVNLGHGILPGTPEASVEAMCNTVAQHGGAAR